MPGELRPLKPQTQKGDLSHGCQRKKAGQKRSSSVDPILTGGEGTAGEKLFGSAQTCPRNSRTGPSHLFKKKAFKIVFGEKTFSHGKVSTLDAKGKPSKVNQGETMVIKPGGAEALHVKSEEDAYDTVVKRHTAERSEL